jgi:acyl-CoA synthetase (AMP-forming)/AMP-acid ligase II
MAETVFAVTQTKPGDLPRILHVNAHVLQTQNRADITNDAANSQRMLSVGRPIAGLLVRIVDHKRRPLPEGQVGEIAISGSCLFSGYYKLPAETERKLCDEWYFTGDLGFLHEGELYVTGRKNDLIIVHGRNFYAHELEYIVNQTPGVHPGRNVAVGWFRPDFGTEEVVVIAESDQVGQSTQLTRAIKGALLTQAGLQVFDVLVAPPGWLVKTTSGKISRDENLKKYLSTLSQPAASAA